MTALIVQCVVGTPEEIRAGQGETAITTAQTAGRLRVSENTVRNFVARGELAPCAEFAGAVLFRESDVERLRASRERRSA